MSSVVFDGAAKEEYSPVDNLSYYQSNYGTPGATGTQRYPANNGGPQNSLGSNSNIHHPIGGRIFSSATAFGDGGFADEPPLLEELGVNFSHMRHKSMAVLNPFRKIDDEVMEDSDLTGPFVFCLLYGSFLLLSGKVHFGYIYGFALVGWFSIFVLLNLMSEKGIDSAKTASILGYCLIPLVLLSGLSIMLALKGSLGYSLAIASIAWCTYSASTIFVATLAMKEQRLLVAYPIGLLYAFFALMAVF